LELDWSGPAASTLSTSSAHVPDPPRNGVALFAFSLIVLRKTIWEAITETAFGLEATKRLAVELIALADFFLLGMVLYVVGIGMFQFFVSPALSVPGWMRVHDLDDLEGHLITVTVVLLAISFLAIVVEWHGDRSILFLGGALAVVILALCAFLLVHQRPHDASWGRASNDERSEA
jgi:uncharacterized membrane protein YqhA